MAADGGTLCPRHAYEAELKQQARDTTDAATAAKRKGGHPKIQCELTAAGYDFVGSSECKVCGKHIEWWRTPNDKRAPYDPMLGPTAAVVSHFATCIRPVPAAAHAALVVSHG